MPLWQPHQVFAIPAPMGQRLLTKLKLSLNAAKVAAGTFAFSVQMDTFYEGFCLFLNVLYFVFLKVQVLNFKTFLVNYLSNALCKSTFAKQ